LQSLRFVIKRFVVSTFCSVDVFVIVDERGLKVQGVQREKIGQKEQRKKRKSV
jgi:hypothetical protein